MRALVPVLLAALLVASGCDSSDDAVALDGDYYVGTWDVVALSDEDRDYTRVLNASFDEITIAFRADRSFRLDADVSDIADGSGAADFTTPGTYQAQPDVPALVLTSRGISATLQASTLASAPDRVRLTAPAAAVNVLLQGLPFQPQGDVSIVIERL